MVKKNWHHLSKLKTESRQKKRILLSRPALIGVVGLVVGVSIGGLWVHNVSTHYSALLASSRSSTHTPTPSTDNSPKQSAAPPQPAKNTPSSTSAPVTSSQSCPDLSQLLIHFSSCSQWCSYEQSLPAIFEKQDIQERTQDASMIASDEATNYNGYDGGNGISLQEIASYDNEFIDTTNQGLQKNYTVELQAHDNAAQYGCYTTMPTQPTPFPEVSATNPPQ